MLSFLWSDAVSDAVKLISTRPTAVNLSWAVNKIMTKFSHCKPKSDF